MDKQRLGCSLWCDGQVGLENLLQAFRLRPHEQQDFIDLSDDGSEQRNRESEKKYAEYLGETV
jgi:hypothetical protein